MKTAVRLQYRPDNPCIGVGLPSGDKAEDEAQFLSHAEFGMIMNAMGARYKAFTNFLVTTGLASVRLLPSVWAMWTSSPIRPPSTSTKPGNERRISNTR
jgi:hypothetical protein